MIQYFKIYCLTKSTAGDLPLTSPFTNKHNLGRRRALLMVSATHTLELALAVWEHLHVETSLLEHLVLLIL